jgi:hypothetical protein
MMDRAPNLWSTAHGLSPWGFRLENEFIILDFLGNFADMSLDFSEINPQSTIL